MSTTAERDKIIDYIRGVDVNDENLNSSTTDDRPWKLGDIFHSTPVLVSALGAAAVAFPSLQDRIAGLASAP